MAPSGASSGEQVSRRWPELFGRAPRLASAYWQRKKRTRGEEVGWAALVGELGRLVAARVRPGRLCSFYFFLIISVFYFAGLF